MEATPTVDVVQSASLSDFFLACVRRTLRDLTLRETRRTTRYLSGLLARYALRVGSEQDGIADRLAEIQRIWQVGEPGFDPAREVAFRRELGDYTLFMSGFLWERVEAMAAHQHYKRVGTNAYRFVAEHHRAVGRKDAALYRALADGFTRYTVVLMYLREVYVDIVPGSRTLPTRIE